MKIKINLLIALAFTFFVFGCATVEMYSFAEKGNESETAVLTFGSGVRFVDLEGSELSEPAERSFWSHSIILPAGKPMDIRVYVFWDGDREGFRRRGIFKCPPLEAGKEYLLSYEVVTIGIFFEMPMEESSLNLSRRSDTGLRIYQQIYKQVIPPLP